MRNSRHDVATIVRGGRSGRTSRALAWSWPFGGYLWARAAAYLGFWAFSLVSAVVMYDRTGSVTMVALLTVAQFVPQFVLTPLSGVLADRGHVATLIVIGFVVTALGPGVLGTWILAAGSVDALPGPWPVLFSSLLVGVGFAIGSASTAAVVPALVEPAELGAAVALNSVPLMLARAAGPAVGGGIAIVAGPAFACLLAATLNLVCAISMLAMRLPQRLGEEGSHSTALSLAVRHCLRQPRLLMVLVAVAALGLGAEPSVTLAPGIAERFGDATKAGWVASAFGVGGVVGLGLLGPLRSRLRHEVGSGWGLLLMGAGLALVAVGTVPPVALLGMALAGGGMTLAHANLAALVQLLSPVDMRGRITALWFLCWLGARPVGAAANGVIADALGAGWALAGVSATLVAASLGCYWAWRTPGARVLC